MAARTGNANVHRGGGSGGRSDRDVSLRAAALALGLFTLAIPAALDGAAAETTQSPQTPLPDTAEAYGIVFDQWLKQRAPTTAILVVRRGGKTIFAKGYGADPQKPTLIASLSKAITGACVATLIRDGKLAFTTPLRAALPQFFKQYGAPLDRRLYQVTVEELLVHRAGLRGNADDDSIYGVFAKRARSGHAWQGAPKMVLSEYLLKDRLARKPGGRYSYSNTGYEILSAIIEEQTGRPYEDYCSEAVFGRLGIAAPKLHPDWRMLAGMGGWFVPGPDYLAFLDIFDPAHPFLGDTVSAWIDQAQTRWSPGNRDRWYSLGVNTWAGAGRWAVSHGGILHVRGRNAAGEPTEGSVLSHAFRAADGTAVFIALEWRPDAEVSLNELRKMIGETHKLVTMVR
jgi:CubicO group peptidase (beta-lactamase class C family)